jgi:hypothetical protein
MACRSPPGSAGLPAPKWPPAGRPDRGGSTAPSGSEGGTDRPWRGRVRHYTGAARQPKGSPEAGSPSNSAHRAVTAPISQESEACVPVRSPGLRTKVGAIPSNVLPHSDGQPGTRSSRVPSSAIHPARTPSSPHQTTRDSSASPRSRSVASIRAVGWIRTRVLRIWSLDQADRLGHGAWRSDVGQARPGGTRSLRSSSGLVLKLTMLV